MTCSRREWLRAVALGAAGALVAARPVAAALRAAPLRIDVYKTPTCGCCKAWVEHLRKNGFAPIVHDMDDLAETKTMLGVPTALRACHTATIGRYLIEGHVPADLVQKLVESGTRDVMGLAVPGMPSGSPGMESDTKEPFDVIAFTSSGKTSVYARR
jgi:hypothetical protein